MKQVVPYFNFSGKCREALEFYAQALGGEISGIQTFGDSPMDVPEEMSNLIMHAEFKADGIFFMASDGNGPKPASSGDQISLSLQVTDLEEQQRMFDALKEGGTVLMDMQDTFWDARFGMLKDKFGVQWMLNSATNYSAQ